MIARRLAALLVILAAGLAGWRWTRDPPPPAIPGVDAAAWRLARDEFRKAYGREPDQLDALSWIAESASRRDAFETARAAFHQIPSDHPAYGHSSRLQEGLVLLRMDRADEALRQLRLFLELESAAPHRPAEEVRFARSQVIYITGALLQVEERQRTLRDAVRAPGADGLTLLLEAFPTLHRWNGPEAAERMARFLDHDPDRLEFRAARAIYLASHGSLHEAAALISQQRSGEAGGMPSRGIAAVAAAYVAHESGKTDELTRLFTGPLAAPPSVPSAAPGEAAEPWMLTRLRGQWALKTDRADLARTQFETALQSDPHSAESWLGLADAAGRQHDDATRRTALRNVRTLTQIQNLLGRAGQQPDDPSVYEEIATLCHGAEFWEPAWRLARFAIRLKPPSAERTRLLERIEREMPGERAGMLRGEEGSWKGEIH